MPLSAKPSSRLTRPAKPPRKIPAGIHLRSPCVAPTLPERGSHAVHEASPRRTPDRLTHRRATPRSPLAALVRRRLRAGPTAAQIRHARPRSRLVPLVPRHGRHHLQRSRRHQAAQREICPRQSRPGLPPRHLQPLPGLRLARHRSLRGQRLRDRQAPGLHPAQAHGFHAASHHRRPLPRP